jgi:uncharacterized membrane protein
MTEFVVLGIVVLVGTVFLQRGRGSRSNQQTTILFLAGMILILYGIYVAKDPITVDTVDLTTFIGFGTLFGTLFGLMELRLRNFKTDLEGTLKEIKTDLKEIHTIKIDIALIKQRIGMPSSS